MRAAKRETQESVCKNAHGKKEIFPDESTGLKARNR
ncbi:hypothetical protein CCACVL1_06422 [Corchorus capsularis]|uniref:Uncharacterized protein n=1 Tax=Corchorus capsularis TaxID=210143 RepID=A0A1R3JFM6_COCAP|nr:hypothetical protein CCACVL1_06422 [Corchorus capsularis]